MPAARESSAAASLKDSQRRQQMRRRAAVARARHGSTTTTDRRRPERGGSGEFLLTCHVELLEVIIPHSFRMKTCQRGVTFLPPPFSLLLSSGLSADGISGFRRAPLVFGSAKRGKRREKGREGEGRNGKKQQQASISPSRNQGCTRCIRTREQENSHSVSVRELSASNTVLSTFAPVLQSSRIGSLLRFSDPEAELPE